MGKGSDQRVGIADVAREAGVSKSAVSFAFNSPDRLSTETASRIRDVADRMGYRPHPVARMLSAGQTTVTQKTDIQIKQEGGALMHLAGGAKLADVVKALNLLGASPADLLAILQALKAAGALRAELEII